MTVNYFLLDWDILPYPEDNEETYVHIFCITDVVCTVDIFTKHIINLLPTQNIFYIRHMQYESPE